ncbi:MAG: hypothetical protein Q7T25_03660, partial [Sideroxyarcus sp.]|nr:hypothetical protein [Sideroxyarcus sp.]
IGILSAIGLNQFSGVREKARDAERKNDLVQISRALLFYFDDFDTYPDNDDDDPGEDDYEFGNPAIDGGVWLAAIKGTYLSPVPVDPVSSDVMPCSYRYKRTDVKQYQLVATLESNEKSRLCSTNATLCNNAATDHCWCTQP